MELWLKIRVIPAGKSVWVGLFMVIVNTFACGTEIAIIYTPL
jgi:hypothetical protein